MDYGQYEPANSVSDVPASKFLIYVAFCIIIALIIFIALVISQPDFIIEPLPCIDDRLKSGGFLSVRL